MLIIHYFLNLLQPVSYAQLARSIHELAATSDQVSIFILLCFKIDLLMRVSCLCF